MFESTYKLMTTLLLLCFVLFIFYHEDVSAEKHLVFGARELSRGDKGADVAILQRKLKKLRLYEGRIDGWFGSKTESAVRDFQQQEGLEAEGRVGSATLKRLPREKLASRIDVSRYEILMLARVIHGEARGENFEGKVGVGSVILNRVKSDKFPDSIREVILQKGQFSSLIDGQANYYPGAESVDAARATLIGYDPTRGAIYFYNPEVATDLRWISSRPVIARIGDHIFAR